MKFPASGYILLLSQAATLHCNPLSSPSSCSPGCDNISYCDTYENTCKPCSVVCEGGGGLEECSAECPDYFRSVIHSHRMEAQQLHQLTVMVALTAVMTCLVLIILTVLMVMKVRKKRRLAKKILPSTVFSIDKEQVKIQNSSTMETISARGLETSYHGPGAEHGGVGGSTVVTQLSHDSSVSQPQLTSSSVPASHSTARPRRLPSEDCVPSYLHQLQSQRPGGDGTPRQYSEVV